MRDAPLISCGFFVGPIMPQQLMFHRDGHIIALAAKIVDDILRTGFEYIVPHIIENNDGSFSLSTVVQGPSSMRWYRMNLRQDYDMSIE